MSLIYCNVSSRSKLIRWSAVTCQFCKEKWHRLLLVQIGQALSSSLFNLFLCFSLFAPSFTLSPPFSCLVIVCYAKPQPQISSLKLPTALQIGIHRFCIHDELGELCVLSSFRRRTKGKPPLITPRLNCRQIVEVHAAMVAMTISTWPQTQGKLN